MGFSRPPGASSLRLKHLGNQNNGEKVAQWPAQGASQDAAGLVWAAVWAVTAPFSPGAAPIASDLSLVACVCFLPSDFCELARVLSSQSLPFALQPCHNTGPYW